jgi:UDP-glucose 4-epimerase
MTHYLITGGAGFIGSHLSERLLSHGEWVTVIDDLSTGCFENIEPLTAHPHFRFAVETIANETVLDRLVSECDTIIHLAAAVGVRLVVEKPVHTITTNISRTDDVLKAARRYRVPTLLASSSEVYGKGLRLPFAEDDDVLLGSTRYHRWAYAVSKMVDEFLGIAYYREYGLPVTSFRLFNTVGPRQVGRYGMVMPRFVGAALTGKPLTVYGTGEQSRCFCHVSDVVRAIAALAQEPSAAGKIYNIGANEPITILSLAERVIQLTESTSEITLVPYHEVYPQGFEDMHRRQPDTSRIRALTGWVPEHTLDDAILDIAHWMKTRPLSNGADAASRSRQQVDSSSQIS